MSARYDRRRTPAPLTARGSTCDGRTDGCTVTTWAHCTVCDSARYAATLAVFLSTIAKRLIRKRLSKMNHFASTGTTVYVLKADRPIVDVRPMRQLVTPDSLPAASQPTESENPHHSVDDGGRTSRRRRRRRRLCVLSQRDERGCGSVEDA